MAVLGLIIALATGAFIASAFLGASDPVSLTVLGTTSTMSVGRWVATGALAGLLFALGLVMLFSGIGRASRRRRETKQVVVTSRTEAEELRLENERLARELSEQQAIAGDTEMIGHPDVDGAVDRDAVGRASVDRESFDLNARDHDSLGRDAVDRDSVDLNAADRNALDRQAPTTTAFVKGHDLTSDGYVPRHGDDTYNAPVAYPAEPAVARADVDAGNNSPRTLN